MLVSLVNMSHDVDFSACLCFKGPDRKTTAKSFVLNPCRSTVPASILFITFEKTYLQQKQEPGEDFTSACLTSRYNRHILLKPSHDCAIKVLTKTVVFQPGDLVDSVKTPFNRSCKVHTTLFRDQVVKFTTSFVL